MGYSQQASYELFTMRNVAHQHLQIIMHNLVFQNITVHLQVGLYYKGPNSVLKSQTESSRRLLSPTESDAKRVKL